MGMMLWRRRQQQAKTAAEKPAVKTTKKEPVKKLGRPKKTADFNAS
nr:MAG TPA: hypothetical protein [Caudoviricetes sp.]